ncbi:MAG TPA: hypothetical protein ENK06_06320 [Gammaproteobacteria bacterium]|nr:hypothetical protein [Gammaproteobacteria bacterium]
MNYEYDLEKVGRSIFPYYLTILFIAPIPFGANRPWAWAILAIFAFLLLFIYLWNYARQNLRPPEISKDIKLILFLLVAWLGYQLFQLIPLPAGLVGLISPKTLALKQIAYGSTDITFLTLSFDVSAGIRAVYKTTLYVSLFVLTICLVQSRDRLRLLILTIVAIGVIQSVWGMGLVFMEDQLILAGAGQHNFSNVVKGTFTNRNHFGGFINLSIAAVIALLLSSGIKEKRRIHREKLSHHWQSRALDWRIYLIPYLGLMLLALVFSESRGAIFSSVFMMLVMVACLLYMKVGFLEIYKKFQLVIWLIIFVTIFSGADMLSSRFSMLDEDMALRMSHWQNSLMIFTDFKIFGIGAGTFQYVYPLYDDGFDKYRLLHAHNDYIELLAEQGVIGFCLIGAVIILCLKNAIQAIRHFTHLHQAAFAVGSLLAISAFLIHSLVDFNFQIPSNAIYFFVFLAIALLQSMESVHVEKRETVWDEDAFLSENS